MLEIYSRSNVGYEYDAKEMSIEYDIRSLTMVYRARGNKKPATVSDAGELFITTNNGLANTAKSYDRECGSFNVPICLTANYLSTFIWIGQPLKYIENCREQMLAYCYAAINPTDKQIKKYYSEIDKLKKSKNYSNDQCNYLRQNPTLMRLYSTISMNVTKDKKVDLLESVEIYKKNIEVKIAEKDTQLDRKVIEILKLKDEKNELASIIDAYNRDEEALNIAAFEYANKKMKKFENGTIPIGMALIGLFFCIINEVFMKPLWLKTAISIATGLISVIGAITLYIMKQNCHGIVDKAKNILRKRYKTKKYKQSI